MTTIILDINRTTTIIIDYCDYNLTFTKNISYINRSHLYYIALSHLIKLSFLIDNIIIINYYLITFNFIYRFYFKSLINEFKYTLLI